MGDCAPAGRVFTNFFYLPVPYDAWHVGPLSDDFTYFLGIMAEHDIQSPSVLMGNRRAKSIRG
jgi:hypothetical protein